LCSGLSINQEFEQAEGLGAGGRSWSHQDSAAHLIELWKNHMRSPMIIFIVYSKDDDFANH
jgi:hypothetical protein